MRNLLRACLVAAVVIGLGAAAFYLHPLWFADQVIRLHLWRSGVRSEYVEVDGYRVHFFEAAPVGGGLGTPLLLIHGLESRGEDWAGVIPSLAAHGYHVYVPDLLGYGRTAKPDISYSIAEQERLVSDFLSAEHIEQADVGGWSMGGWVALKLAVDEPARVQRLILYDSAGLYFKPTFTAADFAPSTPAGVARLSAMLSPDPRKMPDFIARGAERKLQRDAWVVSRSMRSMEAGKDLMDFKLGGLKQPVLIVWGREDRLIPLSVGEAMHRGIAGSNLLIVDGCGHLAVAECTRPVLRATVNFLASQPPWRGLEGEVPKAGGK